jgi:hypothetical protein
MMILITIYHYRDDLAAQGCRQRTLDARGEARLHRREVRRVRYNLHGTPRA